jgi:hypothetical protein
MSSRSDLSAQSTVGPVTSSATWVSRIPNIHTSVQPVTEGPQHIRAVLRPRFCTKWVMWCRSPYHHAAGRNLALMSALHDVQSPAFLSSYTAVRIMPYHCRVYSAMSVGNYFAIYVAISFRALKARLLLWICTDCFNIKKNLHSVRNVLPQISFTIWF